MVRPTELMVRGANALVSASFTEIWKGQSRTMAGPMRFDQYVASSIAFFRSRSDMMVLHLRSNVDSRSSWTPPLGGTVVVAVLDVPAVLVPPPAVGWVWEIGLGVGAEVGGSVGRGKISRAPPPEMR